MRIITHTCPSCGTIVAGNVLEQQRVLQCPGLGCDRVLEFSDLSDEEQEWILTNHEKYRME